MWQRFKTSLRGFMQGRNGSDQLSMFLLIVGLLLTLLSSITRLGLFNLVGIVLYLFAIFRVFSKNVNKRREENQKFLELKRSFIPTIKQFLVRLKNVGKYKYFRCPECKSRLRLPRKVGEVTVTCGKCKHQFKQRA